MGRAIELLKDQYPQVSDMLSESEEDVLSTLTDTRTYPVIPVGADPPNGHR